VIDLIVVPGLVATVLVVVFGFRCFSRRVGLVVIVAFAAHDDS
jgi:hypothetical protein